MKPKFIVWTGRMHNEGTLEPSCSIATAVSLEEAAIKGREWQEYVHRHYPGRKAGCCVITTYGNQSLVASILEQKEGAS
jgi:hypothetical protein